MIDTIVNSVMILGIFAVSSLVVFVAAVAMIHAVHSLIVRD